MKKSGWIGRVLVWILFASGFVLINYPAVAITLGNMNIATKVDYEIGQYPANPSILSDAEKYNEDLTSMPVLDPWLNKIRTDDNDAFDNYTHTLNLDEKGLMGRIVIPSINVNLPVYHDTTDDVLDKGAGHLFGSHLPVGGDNSTSIITAHSGMTSSAMFDNLPQLEEGDLIYMDFGNGEIRAWRMVGSEVILPDEVDSLNSQVGKDRLLLITCTPYGINTHRLVVEALRDVDAEKQVSDLGPASEISRWDLLPWWAKIIFAADTFILGVATSQVVHKSKKRY